MVNKKPVLPFTEKTIEKDAQQWLNIIRYHESGMVIKLQDDCVYRIPQIINDKKLLRKVLGPYYRKYLLAHISLGEKNLLSCIKENLIDLCQKRRLKLPDTTPSISEILKAVANQGLEVGLLISDIRRLIREKNFQPFFDLEYLTRQNPNFSTLLFPEIDLTQKQYSLLLDECSSLFTNVIKYPLYSEADSRQFLKYLTSQWGLKITKEEKEKIIKQCGGFFWLMSQALRHLRNHPKASLEEVFTNELMIRKLEIIWERLSKKEKNILKKVVKKSLSKEDKTSHEYQYLKTIKIINEKNNQVRLGLPLLKKAIDKEKKASQLMINEGKIWLNKKDVSHEFTAGELRVLELFLKKKRQLISRDEIAKQLWRSDWEEKYSDWAIDRLIYRLRQKLKTIGMDEKLLKTLKARGFCFG